MQNQNDLNAQPQAAAEQQPVNVPGPQETQTIQGQKSIGTSGLAIAGLILGVLAIVCSPIPILNNLAPIPGVLGLVFGIIAMLGISKGKSRGKGLAIAAIVLGIVSFAVVLGTQQMYSNALDNAIKGASVASTSSANVSSGAEQNESSASNNSQTSSSSNSNQSSKSNQAAGQDLAVGTTATLDNGLAITVNSVSPGLKNYDKRTVTGINVTYTNTGEKSEDFNSYNWKAQDAQGAQRNTTFYSEDKDGLDFGSLAPGGTVTGNLYFEGDVVKALYFENTFINKEPTASWIL